MIGKKNVNGNSLPAFWNKYIRYHQVMPYRFYIANTCYCYGYVHHMIMKLHVYLDISRQNAKRYRIGKVGAQMCCLLTRPTAVIIFDSVGWREHDQEADESHWWWVMPSAKCDWIWQTPLECLQMKNTFKSSRFQIHEKHWRTIFHNIETNAKLIRSFEDVVTRSFEIFYLWDVISLVANGKFDAPGTSGLAVSKTSWPNYAPIVGRLSV